MSTYFAPKIRSSSPPNLQHRTLKCRCESRLLDITREATDDAFAANRGVSWQLTAPLSYYFNLLFYSIIKTVPVQVAVNCISPKLAIKKTKNNKPRRMAEVSDASQAMCNVKVAGTLPLSPLHARSALIRLTHLFSYLSTI